MSLLLIVFGIFSGCFVSVLVGLIGAQRNIGFGWSFVLSLLLTPVVGLLITLLSDPLSSASGERWGCLGVVLSILGGLLLIPFFMLLVAIVTALFFAPVV